MRQHVGTGVGAGRPGARRLDVGLGGRYLLDGDAVSIWGDPASGDDAPLGGFSVDLARPGDGWSTLHALWWDPTRSDEAALRAGIRHLAGRLGDRPARAHLRRPIEESA